MAGQAVANNDPLKFFLLTFGLSWLFWIPAALIPGSIMSSSWVILLYLGGLGPAAAAIILTYRTTDAATRKTYWSRVFGFKRIGGLWYLIILFAYPSVSVIATYIIEGQIQLSEMVRRNLAHPLQFIPFLVFLYLFGPFPEELGWRGYALDGLQRRMSPVWSSLLLGVCWASWHIPLFLMRGTYQFELGFGSFEFWIFMLSAVVISVFFTWIYNHNQNSILSASLFHFSVNLTGNVLFETQTVRLLRLAVLIGLAVILILRTRLKNLLGFYGPSGQPTPSLGAG